jgi:cyclic pyranopterin phosphate synthase
VEDKLNGDPHLHRGFTHVNERGQANMVNVLGKDPTRRVAIARCVVRTSVDLDQVLGTRIDGLDIIESARVAGVQGAKLTSTLIPLCHPILLDAINVEITAHQHRCEIAATAEITERTGVEMEALTACAMNGLSLVNALVAWDPDAFVDDLTLWHKSGGRSGTWQRAGDPTNPGAITNIDSGD